MNNGLIPGNSTENFEFLPSSNFDCGNFTTSNVYPVVVNATSIDSMFSIIKTLKVEHVTMT